jgi:hypothetical protein
MPTSAATRARPICAGFERGRSAGMRFIIATQSLSNLATAGGDKLLHAAQRRGQASRPAGSPA